MGVGGIRCTGRLDQEAVTNPFSLPDLQVGPSLESRLAMDMYEDITGDATPLTDAVRLLLKSYPLKVVCNSN